MRGERVHAVFQSGLEMAGSHGARDGVSPNSRAGYFQTDPACDIGKQMAGGSGAGAALMPLTKVLALEGARHDNRVSALCPGCIDPPINTDFSAGNAGKALVARNPLRRPGRPTDLDFPLSPLGCDHSADMTGSVHAVVGGHLVSAL